MTKIVQDLAPQILEEIKKANKILLSFHPRPDADSIGASLAMMQALEAMGKNVTVIRGDSEVSPSLSGLPGFEKLVNKNLSEIDLTQFDLFIIQDISAIDRISAIVPVVFPSNLKTINIDHHSSNTNFAQINLVDTTYPATCQILYDLFVLWNVEITPDMAKCLMLGMYYDSGGFKFPKTTSSTLAAAAHLAKIAPDYISVIDLVDNSNTPGVIAYEGLALSLVTLYCHDHVAISAVSFKDLQDKKIAKVELFPDIARILKSVVGWEIGVKMVEDQPGGVKVSFRTRDEQKYDVARIAVALGGGGHKAASAVYIKSSLEEAVKKVVETIDSIYPELAE